MTYKRTITKFNRGAVDEKFMARDDVERVVDTCAEMKNLLPIRLGPTQYRPGTQWLEYAGYTGDQGGRLIPFLVSGNNSVVLEFFQSLTLPVSLDYLRIWIDGVPLSRTGTVDVITNGEFTTDLTGWTDGSDVGATAVWDSYGLGSVKLAGNGTGAYGRISQALTVTPDTKRTIRIHVGGPQVEILIGTGGVDSGDIISGIFRKGMHSLTFTPSASPVTITLRTDVDYATFVNAVVYESAGEFAIFMEDIFPDTTGTAAVVQTLRYTQSADVMYICSNGQAICGQAHPLVLVERRGNESWSITVPEFQDGPFGVINTTQLTLATDALTGECELTASLPLFLDDTWTGRSYKLVHTVSSEPVEGIVVIIEVTDSTHAVVRVVKPIGALTATVDWYPGRFSRYQPGPTAVAIFDGRLWLGGDGMIDGSVSDAYLSFDGSIEGDSKAISKTIGFGPVQQVLWLSAGRELLMGTGSAEIKIGSNDFGDTITQSNCRLTVISSIGSAAVEPERIDDLVYFVQRAGKRIIEITEAGNGTERTPPRDVQLLHPDICSAGIKRLALTRNPEMRLWAIMNDGAAAACLLDSSENVNGWSTIEMLDAELLDVAVIPDNEEDELYFTIRRGGDNDNMGMERLAPSTEAIGATISKHYDGHILLPTPGTSSDLFWHLNGQDVHVWVNGKEHGPYTVDIDGVVTFPTNTWEDAVVGVRHHGHYLSNRLAHYIPQSVINDRKRVTHLGLVMRNVVMKTVTYGDGDYCGYKLPIEDQAIPSEDPTVLNTVPEIGATPTITTDGTNIYVNTTASKYCAPQFAPVADYDTRLWSYNSPGPWAYNAHSDNFYHLDFQTGVKEDGTLWAKGDANTSGQLGVGDTLARSVWTQIGAQTYWTDCFVSDPSIVLAVTLTGRLYTWGTNPLKLGGTTANVLSPRQIGGVTTWCNVAAGKGSCYGLRQNGTLWSWGTFNTYIGRAGVVSSVIQVGTDSDWSQISVNGAPGTSTASCAAIKENGTLWTWGDNSVGQLGQGDLVDRASPVQVGVGTDWHKVVSCGWALFGIKTNGTLWVSGGTIYTNGRGVTQFDTQSPTSSFVQIGSETDWLDVAAGGGGNGFQGTIRALRGAAGTAQVYMWGYYVDPVTASTLTFSNSPIAVGSESNWVKLAPRVRDVYHLYSDYNFVAFR